MWLKCQIDSFFPSRNTKFRKPGGREGEGVGSFILPILFVLYSLLIRPPPPFPSVRFSSLHSQGE
jgi:hypothetical protein